MVKHIYKILSLCFLFVLLPTKGEASLIDSLALDWLEHTEQWLLSDSVIHHRYDSIASVNAISNLEDLQQNQELLPFEHQLMIQQRIARIEEYHCWTVLFKNIIRVDGQAKEKLELLSSLGNPSPALIKAYVKDILLPCWKLKDFASLNGLKIPYLKHIYDNLANDIDIILTNENASMADLKHLLEYQDAL